MVHYFYMMRFLGKDHSDELNIEKDRDHIHPRSDWTVPQGKAPSLEAIVP